MLYSQLLQLSFTVCVHAIQFTMQITNNLISRYCTQNDLWSSSRRRYSSDIPAFFHNRPHKLVAHCQKRLEEALLIEEGDIQATESMKVYRVAAVSQAEPYLVDLNVPQCCCYDWRANLYPCKHMFAALHRRKGVFTDLPESYTMNPWFCLDQEVMRVEQQPINDGHENEQSPVKAIDVHRESLEALEKRPRIKLTASSQCRELLQELRSKTYLVHDPSVLQDLKEVLIQEIQRVNRSLWKEDDLPVECNMVRQKKCTNKTEEQMPQETRAKKKTPTAQHPRSQREKSSKEDSNRYVICLFVNSTCLIIRKPSYYNTLLLQQWSELIICLQASLENV